MTGALESVESYILIVSTEWCIVYLFASSGSDTVQSLQDLHQGRHSSGMHSSIACPYVQPVRFTAIAEKHFPISNNLLCHY